MSKKKKTKVVQMSQSPENYFKSGRARKLPIHECLIRQEWEQDGIAPIVVARKHINGNISWGTFLVDTYCLGVKNTMYAFNRPEEEYEDFKDEFGEGYEATACGYVLAHNIIYGSVEYAEDYGFEPHKEFNTSQYILEEDDEHIELMDIEFGMDGKPCYFVGPDEDERKANQIIATLERTAGPGKFTVVDEDGDDEEWENEDEPLFEEGEIEEIIKGEKKPDIYQNYAISRVLYEDVFPKEKSTIGFTKMEDLDMERLFEDLAPSLEYYPASEAEAEDIEEFLFPPEGTSLEKQALLIQKCIAKHPHVYSPYQMLLVLLWELKEAVPEFIFENFYQKFPDTPLSKILNASVLISNGRIEQAFALLKHSYKIQDAFPEENGIFAEEEIFSFCAVLCRYFTAINDLATAHIYAEFIIELDEIDDPNVMVAFIEMINKMTEKVEHKTGEKKN